MQSDVLSSDSASTEAGFAAEDPVAPRARWPPPFSTRCRWAWTRDSAKERRLAALYSVAGEIARHVRRLRSSALIPHPLVDQIRCARGLANWPSGRQSR